MIPLTDEAFQRGQECALRLRRAAAERREQGISEPAPVHVRKRLPKGCQVHVFTARLSIPVFLRVCELCAQTGREANIVLDDLLRRAVGLDPL